MTARIPLVINSGAIQELQSGDNFNLGTGASLTSPTIATSMVLSYGTANQVQFLNGSKQLVGDADLTFDGTTLSATNFTSSGTVTLSGGTANGVAYLNGSKVLTTGGSLTFDGTSLNVGLSGNAAIFGSASTAETSISVKRGSDVIYLGGDTTSHYLYGTGTLPISFLVNSTERMRLTSTGLGIGTSSPGYKLDVNGVIHNNTNIFVSHGAQGNASGITFGGNGSNYGRIYEATNDRWALGYTASYLGASTEVLNWNSSGNLGLGVTPSASNLPTVQSTYGIFVGSNQTNITANAYYSSGWKYVQSGVQATRYSQLGTGAHVWEVAGSGTAGNAISFTQAMTLDANGNLGIGTSSPGQKLDVRGITQLINSTAGTATVLKLGNDDTSTTAIVKAGFSSAGTIKASINAAVYGNDYMTFNVGSDTERMRIDSSGNLLVGTTSTDSGRSCIEAQTNGIAISFRRNTGVYGSNTKVGQISCDSTSTTYTTSSDYRLKENIQPMQNALETVSQLNPVTYNWKADGSTGQGFIAHELQAVVPDCVSGEKDAVDVEGKPVYQGIDTSFLVATLCKAIQELEARVKQLEGK